MAQREAYLVSMLRQDSLRNGARPFPTAGLGLDPSRFPQNECVPSTIPKKWNPRRGYVMMESLDNHLFSMREKEKK